MPASAKKFKKKKSERQTGENITEVTNNTNDGTRAKSF